MGLWPIYKHALDDHNHFRLIAAQLITSGSCKQCEQVKSFAVSRKKLNRSVKQIMECGVASFFKKRSERRGGTVFTSDKLRQAQQLLNQGASRCTVASELGTNYDTLRKAINDGRIIESITERLSGSTMSSRSRIDILAA